MNPFAERYKTLSNTDLLKIIDNGADYQPLAVETAYTELANRKLAPEVLENAKAEINLELQQKVVQKEKRQAFENKVKDIGALVIDAVHPIQQSTPSTNRIINFLSAALGIMFLLTLFKEFSFITFMLFSKESRWDWSTPLDFLELIILPVFAILFWRRKKLGWVLFCICCCYLETTTVFYFFMELKAHIAERYMAINNLFPLPSAAAALWNIIFFGACLWFICKRSIREVYQVSDQSAVLIAGTTTAVMVGIIWGLLTGH